MTDADLEAIRPRAEAATNEGVWCYDLHDSGGEGVRFDLGDDAATIIEGTWYAYSFSSADADLSFIAHARKDVPDLLAEVERLRTENVELHAAIAEAIIEEVERLRTIVAVLTTEDPPCTGWDRAYFGGPVLDADGVALADQAVLLMEPCAHAHGPGYWEAMAGRDG